LSAAAVIGFGSLLITAPALAEQPKAEVPDEAPVEIAAQLAEAGVDVVAIGINEAGEPVLVQTDDSATNSQANRAIEAAGTELGGGDVQVVTIGAPLEAYSSDEVVGGAGYAWVTPAGNNQVTVSSCSIGFAAWNAESEPVALSAGHCTDDGAASELYLTDPSGQPAHTGNTNNPGDPSKWLPLGNFGFSQYGGTGNTASSNGDENATDISVIEGIDAGLTLLPEVIKWGADAASNDDLAADTVKVKTAGGDPVVGAIQKSGRTTGLTEGQFRASDLVDGWAQVSGRWVRGFSSNVPTDHGDSGGAVMQLTDEGANALGVVSGGVSPDENDGQYYTWTSSLKHALPHLPGTEVALDIDAPTVASPAPNAAVPGGSSIVIAAPSNATQIKAALQPIDSNSLSAHAATDQTLAVTNGQATVAAPATPGDYEYTLVAVNGKSSSASTTFKFSVTLAAPTITTVDQANPSVTVQGTGLPGAIVTVTGDVTGTATVAADGTWSLPATDLAIGSYKVSASQAYNGFTSPTANGSITVRPATPAITSIDPDTTFPVDQGPASLSGTGTAGATVTVLAGGKAYTATVDAQGKWSVKFDAALASGEYTLSATQTIDGIDSQTATVHFTVAAATPPAAQPTNGDLPSTGASSPWPIGVASLSLIALGAAAYVFAAARRKKLQS